MRNTTLVHVKLPGCTFHKEEPVVTLVVPALGRNSRGGCGELKAFEALESLSYKCFFIIFKRSKENGYKQQGEGMATVRSRVDESETGSPTK